MGPRSRIGKDGRAVGCAASNPPRVRPVPDCKASDMVMRASRLCAGISFDVRIETSSLLIHFSMDLKILTVPKTDARR